MYLPTLITVAHKNSKQSLKNIRNMALILKKFCEKYNFFVLTPYISCKQLKSVSKN